MPISITLRTTVTTGGVTHAIDGVMTIQARKVSHNSRDITNSFAQIAQAINGAYIIINNGDEAAYVQMQSNAPDYMVFQCVPGGHIVLPTYIEEGSTFNLAQLNARSATSAGTNITVICIDTNL